MKFLPCLIVFPILAIMITAAPAQGQGGFEWSREGGLKTWGNVSVCPSIMAAYQNMSPAKTSKTTRKAVTPPPAPANLSAQASRVVALMNAERQKAGVAPLATNSGLTHAAQNYSSTMARLNPRTSLSHTLGGTTFANRAHQAGYQGTTGGENIAFGYASPDSAMKGWMNSPGHRRNILNPAFREVGVAAQANSQGQLYWTVDFGGGVSPKSTKISKKK